MPPGDLYIHLTVVDHDRFTRHGNHLEHKAKIDAIAVVVGTKYQVTAIDGNKISVSIPPGTQPGTKLRVPGKGMPLREHVGAFGDLIVNVDIVVPTKLPAETINVLRQIQIDRGIDNI